MLTRITLRGKNVLLMIFTVCYTYAIIRYHIGKNLVGWIHIPYVINKAVSWTAGIFMVLTLLPEVKLMHFLLSRKTLGIAGYFLAILHIVTNVVILRPSLFPEFYANDVISSAGWIYILVGILAFIAFTLPLYASWKKAATNDFRYKFGKLGILLVTIHAASMGITGWLNPLSWPLMMPPITLLFCLFAITFLIHHFTKSKSPK